MARVLALAHHPCHSGPPDQGVADDTAAGTSRAAQLGQAVAQVTQAVHRPFGELVIVALERTGGELEPAGQVRKRRCLGTAQQRDRLRRKQDLREHECHSGADQGVGQPLGPGPAVGHGDGEDGTGGRLGDHDPGAA
jgi:hypothetical protein